MEQGLTNLLHTRKELSGGGMVLVLNTGAEIGPEAAAMLQALHSRSTGGVLKHLEVLKEKGAEKFMSTFYVGYGHKSIGDCGGATLFVEGVSMLAAKAIQDWPLYSGQESSTRYVDFAQQPFLNPLGTKDGETILESWRSFYLRGVTELPAFLKEQFPRGPDEKESVYDKAINARAFDIMRSFLPAGAATNLAWTMNLRQFADALLHLRHHPLAEVREIAETAEQALLTAFPSSFTSERFAATEAYNKSLMESYYFNDPQPVDFELFFDGVDRTLLSEYTDALRTRPNNKTELPARLGESGMVGFRFLLDFGSFRDIQRHRAVRQRMPLVTTEHGFHPWYLSELPAALRREAETLVAKQTLAVKALDTTEETRQYYIAMGFLGTNRVVGTLPALVYLAELRSTRFVHPTLRVRARQMATALTERFAPNGLVIHLGEDPDRFDIARGEHDIVTKVVGRSE